MRVAEGSLKENASQKTENEQSKINVNSMLTKEMQKSWKTLPNGADLGAKIVKSSIENAFKNLPEKTSGANGRSRCLHKSTFGKGCENDAPREGALALFGADVHTHKMV